MAVFKLIVEDSTCTNIILGIDMIESLECDVKKNGNIEIYNIQNIDKFSSNTDYIAKVYRIANNFMVIVKNFKIVNNSVLFI